jgi:carboxyl-terminal processing protease
MAGIHPGDIIESIDDMPIEVFFKQQSKYIPASSDRAARQKLFARDFLFPERFELRLDGGKRFVVDRKANKTVPATDKTEGRWIKEGNIAYIKIPSFGNPSFEEDAVSLVKTFQSAKTLILDVRNNNGGSTPESLIRLLMDKPYRFWSESRALVSGMLEYFQSMLSSRGQKFSDYDRGYAQAVTETFTHSMLTGQALYEQPDHPIFHGQVIFLVNGKCVSACEDLVEPFKDQHRAILLGETTQGSSGQPYYCDLGNGMKFAVGAKRLSFPDGKPFEGVGIEPDIKIGLSIQDLKTGTDSVLDKAIAIAETNK